MIQGLKQDPITQFTGKAVTKNLAESNPGSLLSAKNVLILSDGQLRRAPGYTLVTAVGSGPTKAFYDFQRNVDQKQIVFVESGSEIYWMNADGSGLTLLSTGETGTHQWVSNSFAAYSSDGHKAWRYVDVAGTLTKYQWGITAPTIAPAISLSAGTLTLTYGRTYVYCFVSKYTDSLGIQRISVSAPSPVSAHTGPIAAQVVLLFNLQVSADPQVNYKWIFEVSDSPFDTSATYYFAAEIPNSQTSWGDSLIDDALDTTRLAPWDNNPAPPAPMLAEFQNRIVAANGSLMQLSGYSEITLGIPEEAWPASLFFNLPSGKRTISGLATMQQGTILIVSTQDYFYAYTGYDAITFTEQDRVGSPGFAGTLARVLTPEGLMYLGANQSVRVWRGPGGPEPTSISDDNAKKLQGTYAMEDIDPGHIQESQCLWYDFGPMNLLVVFARTSDTVFNQIANGQFDNGTSTGWIFGSGWTIASGAPFDPPPGYSSAFIGPGTSSIVSQSHVVCIPGQNVQASCWALGEPGATGTAQLRITFFNASGVQIGSPFSSDPVLNNYIWAQPAVSATAPALTAWAIVDFTVTGSTGGPSHWYATKFYCSSPPGFNLMQLWSFVTQAQDSSGTYGSGSGVYTQLTGTYLTDKLPSDLITAAGSVNVGFAGQDFIFMGDAAGNVYRWPDGFTDNGNQYYGIAQHAWHLPNEGKSRYYWADLVTDRADSALGFQVYAATADAPDQGIFPIPLTVQQLPSPVRQSGFAIRASMSAPGTATGKYYTFWISFPRDNADAVVRKVTLASRPINAGISLRPYYEHAGIQIFYGDCREILPELPDGAIVSDPPYGMSWDGKVTRGKSDTRRAGTKAGGYGVSIIEDDKPFDPTFILERKEVIIWGLNHFPQHLTKGTALVWLKRYDDGFGSFLSDAEIAWMNKGCGVYCKRDVSMQGESANRKHPAQKPVDLMQWCIGFVDAPLIIDPFMGSGTTLVAAKNLSRKAIGVEIEERYCEIAAKRLSQEVFEFSEVLEVA